MPSETFCAAAISNNASTPGRPAKRWADLSRRIVMLVVASLLMTQDMEAVTLAWNRNSEPDIAGYRVHYGIESRVYTQMLDVGNNTTATISNLASGNTYFFAVTAYNTAGLESLPSTEVSVSPNQAPVAVSDSIATDEGVPATINVLSNDSDPDNGPSTLSIQSVGSATHGTTSVSANGVIYSPAPGFFGTDSFSYTLTDGALTASATVTVNVRSTGQTANLVDAGLTGSNVGTATGGSRVLSDGSWELTGAGAGMSGIADSVHFESARQRGDFQAFVRIQSLAFDGAAPEAGLMLRESTAANARFAMLAATPAGYVYGSRTIAGGSASRTSVAVPAQFPNVWMLIQRQGNNIEFATSADGVAFDLAGSATLASLAEEVDVGVFASSGTAGVSARAVATDFTIIDMASASGPKGLSAQYFSDKTLTNLKLSRVDPRVDFSWGTSSPDPALPSDQFSVRWKGKVQPAYSETYTFYTLSDDGVRLWVNGTLLINNWTDHGPTENQGSITLTAGQKYDIVMEYYDNAGSATARLMWSSTRQPKEIIPESALTPDVPEATGLSAQYFSDKTLTSLKLSRVDAGVDFSWGTSSPDPALPPNQFSVRWKGKVQPAYSEAYTFYTQSDDGVRLWVNGTLLVNNWTDHGLTENQGSITLTAGQKYDIVMEYYENAGDATARLMWSSTRQAKEIIPESALTPDSL